MRSIGKEILQQFACDTVRTVVVGSGLSGQEETHPWEHRVVGLEVGVEGALGGVSAQVPAVWLGADVSHGLQDVVVQEAEVVLLAPQAAVLGLGDAVGAGIDFVAAGVEDTDLPCGETRAVVVGQEPSKIILSSVLSCEQRLYQIFQSIKGIITEG